MNSKTLNFSSKDLDKAGYNIPPQNPTKGQNKIEAGIITENKILKIFEKEEFLTAYMISKKYKMPDRTAGYALERMKRKGLLTDKYEMLLSADKKRRLNHVFRLVKKNGKRKENK